MDYVETKMIFSKNVARELMKKGNIVFKTIPNYNIKGYVIWEFELTEKLLNDLTSITISNSHQLNPTE